MVLLDEENERSLQMRVTVPRKRWPKRSTDMNALLMGEQITFIQEGCALDMVQRFHNAAEKDAQIRS